MTNKKPRAKKQTLASFQKEYKEMQKMTPFLWDEEKNATISYYKVFDMNIVEDLFKELLAIINYTEENNIDFFKGELGEIKLRLYVQFLIVKYFTELGKEIPDSSFNEQRNILDQLIGLGHWDRIFNEMLPPYQVERVMEKFEEMVERGYQFQDILQKELAKLDKLENKEILSKSLAKPIAQPFNVLASPTQADA